MHSVLSLLLAHGVGGRSDLPISEWIAAWSGAIALLLSFAALGLLWHHPKFPQALIGRLVPTPKFLTQIFLLLVQAIAMTLFLVVLTACFFGPDNTVSNMISHQWDKKICHKTIEKGKEGNDRFAYHD